MRRFGKTLIRPSLAAVLICLAGEAEVDEPLPIEHLGHFFEDLDAPGVVLNQVVVGGKDGCDTTLDLQTWHVDLCP